MIKQKINYKDAKDLEDDDYGILAEETEIFEDVDRIANDVCAIPDLHFNRCNIKNQGISDLWYLHGSGNHVWGEYQVSERHHLSQYYYVFAGKLVWHTTDASTNSGRRFWFQHAWLL